MVKRIANFYSAKVARTKAFMRHHAIPERGEFPEDITKIDPMCPTDLPILAKLGGIENPYHESLRHYYFSTGRIRSWYSCCI